MSKMKELAYYNGNVGTPDELMVPFNDRVHFFGDGVYDATVGANGHVFLLQDHLDRFYSSAKALDITIPMDKAELGALLTELLAKVEGESQFVYWQVTRGSALRDHVYDPAMHGNLWVMIRPAPLMNPDKPIAVGVTADKRFQYGNIKTLNLLPAVLYSQSAKLKGYQENILHRNGVVTECAHSNVSILKDGIFISHPNDDFILRGIAKTHMIQACYRLGISVIERPFTLEELYDADEIIVSSSSKFCLYVNEIEGKPAGGKDRETLKRIQDAVCEEFFEYTGCTQMGD